MGLGVKGGQLQTASAYDFSSRKWIWRSNTGENALRVVVLSLLSFGIPPRLYMMCRTDGTNATPSCRLPSSERQYYNTKRRLVQCKTETTSALAQLCFRISRCNHARAKAQTFSAVRLAKPIAAAASSIVIPTK